MIHFSNLFNGDQALGENMNRFLNENWRSIFEEMKPVLFDTFGKVINTYFNNIFATVPYKDMFLES